MLLPTDNREGSQSVSAAHTAHGCSTRCGRWVLWQDTSVFLKGLGVIRKASRGIPWVSLLESKGVQDGWWLFRKEVLKAQELAVPLSSKMSRRGRRPAGRDEQGAILEDPGEQENLPPVEEGTADSEREIAGMCRGKIRKAQLELSLAAEVKRNKEPFYKDISGMNPGAGSKKGAKTGEGSGAQT